MMTAIDPETVAGFRPLAELVPADWQRGAIETGGARISYARTGGAKPPLLLLHGLQASGLTWLRAAQALADRYDVIMPDIRGHGLSSRVPAALTAADLVADMRALVDQLSLGRPFLAGHSMGADLAGRLAAEIPARALILIDPALQNFASLMPPTGEGPPPWMASIFAVMEQIRSQPHAERMRTGLRLLPPGARLWEERDYVSFVEAAGQFDPAFYQAMAAMGYLFEEPETIRRISCPALLLTARPMFPGPAHQAGIAAFAGNWRAGERVDFPDSGHAIQFDQFERFVETAAAFLDRSVTQS